MNNRLRLTELFDAWRAADALRAVAFFAPSARYVEVGHVPIVGRDAIAAHFTAFFRDGPRFAFDVDDVLYDGERAAVRYRFTTIDSSGARTERAGCAFVIFSDGLIAEWREYAG